MLSFDDRLDPATLARPSGTGSPGWVAGCTPSYAVGASTKQKIGVRWHPHAKLLPHAPKVSCGRRRACSLPVCVRRSSISHTKIMFIFVKDLM